MSYDLYLKPRSGEFSKDRFLEYFLSRNRYRLQGEQVWYQNKDTGVYFSFEMHKPETGKEIDDGAADYPVSFNMNFFRPSFFALEAQPELSSVVRELDFVVFDPQIQGMGNGEFDPSRFLSGWRQGNALGYSAILQDPGKRPGTASMPVDKLERIWRWNHERRKLQEELGESVFVPRISFLKEGGEVISSVVWSDGIPTAFPNELDAVIVYLKALAPRTLFWRKEAFATVSWNSVRPLVERFADPRGSALVGTYSTPPEAIVKFLRSLPPDTQKPEGVNADSVLDAELVAKYSA